MPIIRMPDGVNVRFDDNMPKEQIQSMIASKYPDFAKSMGYNPLKMTAEQRTQAQQKAKDYRERVKPTTFSDKVSEFLVTNPIARQVGFGLQGIANAGLNPAGYIARAAGVDTKPLEAQTAGERATELAGQYGYDAAALVPTLGLLASSAPAIAPYVAPLVEGGVPLALTGSTGSALLTGMIDPENPYARMATDLIGGGLSAGLTRPKISAPKQDVKTVKELTKSIGEDALARDIAESERTGRSLLEVGGDEVLQAAQRAKQQTPEARGILNNYMQQAIEQQPARTEGVINQALGTQGKNATIAQVAENAKREAQPLYKELEDIGDLAKYETRDLPQQNFKRWFEGSKVVDENGQPLKLYHGTESDFDAFNPEKSFDGAFYFTPDENFAKEYSKGKIKEVYASVKNPTTTIPASKKQMQNLVEQGYDGVIYTDNSGKKIVAAFNPNQIKSVNNSGAWSESTSLTDAGWTPESQSQLARVIKDNDVLADTISKVKRANSSLKNLPDTDFKVVNEARKALSQASMNRTELSGYEARQALKELDPILNEVTGGKLAQANKIYQDAYQFEKAADLGREVFNARKSPDDLKNAYNALSSSEKQAAKIGLREEMMNKIGSAVNETNALNRFLPKNVREKIITIAGEKEGGRIIDEAEQAVKLRRNFNQTFSGSQTAEKQSLRDKAKGLRGFIRNPWDTTADVILAPFDNASNVRMAEYLTNPRIADAYRNIGLNKTINARMPKTNYAPITMRAIFERLNEEKK